MNKPQHSRTQRRKCVSREVQRHKSIAYTSLCARSVFFAVAEASARWGRAHARGESTGCVRVGGRAVGVHSAWTLQLARPHGAPSLPAPVVRQ